MSWRYSHRKCQEVAERELAMRRKDYPNLVRNGKMSHAQATEEIAVMEQIAKQYKAAAERDESKRAPKLDLK